MTVRDEERHLAEAVERVLQQTYDGPLDLVIAVGPSHDRTREVADALALAHPELTVIDNPTGRTPHGLNAAVRACAGEVVVRVDGHAILPEGYVRTAVETLQQTGADNVGGLMDARGTTPFEQAVACAMRSKIGVGAASFHVGGGAGEADTVYLGVFRRTALERVGGYDEHFQRAQDWEMNHRIRATGGRVWFTPDLKVTYRPRDSVRALASQYFHYGRWRRVVSRHHPGTINARYLAPPVTAAACALGVVASPLVPWALVVPGAYLAGVLVGSAVVGRELSWRARPLLPVALATMHLSWGTGFLSSPRALSRRADQDVAAATEGASA
ncbi:succinoglycan biosynthesis glycosyltransferase ExoA [Angustibacter peucedani]